MAKQFTLAADERLKSRKLIEQLFDEGKSFAVQPYRVYYILKPGEPQLQFGTGVSAKNFKKAVDRNRVKRLTREAYRLQKLILQQTLANKKQQLSVFFIYTGKELPEFDLVKQKLEVILNRLIKVINESNSADT